ncbi:MAG TPA: FG-GAP-like repeat-containing protein [Solirubrobacteraceae bacterium]|jgi:Ca2+-binding RTX toxin-like protein|nr:FG-GAP-like repeat-containing protein [Solirubrobacteraceae bacterium]
MTSRIRTSLVAAGASAIAALGMQAAPALAGPPSFGTATNLNNLGAGTYGVAVGDLNGDGNPDIVSAIRATGLSVFLGTGGGSFGSATKYAAPSGSSSGPLLLSIVLADLNGDGHLDVVGQAARDNAALVWLGDGSGGFGAGSQVQLNPTPGCGLSNDNPCVAAFPFDVVVADFNEDGKPDIATANSSTNNVSIALGNGDGTFGTATQVALSAGDGPQALQTADMNGDGHADLVVADGTSNKITVLLGDGHGGFAAPAAFAAGITNPAKLRVADVDGDGKLDVVAINTALSGQVAVLAGDGAGSLGTASVISAGVNPSSLSIADVNGDGHDDLVISEAGANDVLTLTGDGAGGFASPLTFGLNGGLSPQAVAVADLDGDGRPDAVTANGNASPSNVKDVSVLSNTANRAPVATNDSYSHTGADTALNVSAAGGVLSNDTDADGNTLTAALVSGPSNGTVTLNPDGSFSYQANGGFVGTDSFTYKANDGTDDSNTVPVMITVTAGCNGLAATITGSGIVNGTSGDDVIVTGNGADTINGGNGNDTICSYGANDIVSGGNGNDYINGGDGDDTLSGGNDMDTILGSAGNDSLSGGNANDTLLGQAGNDSLTGGNDNDTVVGGADSDVLAGNNGTDHCAGDNDGGATLSGTDSVAPSGSCETVVEVP